MRNYVFFSFIKKCWDFLPSALSFKFILICWKFGHVVIIRRPHWAIPSHRLWRHDWLGGHLIHVQLQFKNTTERIGSSLIMQKPPHNQTKHRRRVFVNVWCRFKVSFILEHFHVRRWVYRQSRLTFSSRVVQKVFWGFPNFQTTPGLRYLTTTKQKSFLSEQYFSGLTVAGLKLLWNEWLSRFLKRRFLFWFFCGFLLNSFSIKSFSYRAKNRRA